MTGNSPLPLGNAPEQLLTTTLNGRPAITSLELAERFEIKHQHVLRDIKAISVKIPDSFREPNFGLTSRTVAGPNNSSRQEPMYLLTRDGFTLLAMGYNSKRAIEWKIRYIEAFNALEAHALELAGEAGYRRGLASGVTPLALEAAEKASWLKGFKEGERQMRRKDGLNRLEKAVPYLQKGLTRTEIARLLDCPPSTLKCTIRRFKRLLMQVSVPPGKSKEAAMQNFANFDARFTFVSEIFRLLQKSEKPLLSETGLNGFKLIMDDLLALSEERKKSRQGFSNSLWNLSPASERIN